MRGLLEKDFYLLMANKLTILILTGLSVYLGFCMYGTFVLGYLPFVITMLIVGTLSYDEMDHGFQFLMTLPVDARLYVREKYVLCLLGSSGAWVIAVMIYGSNQLIREGSISVWEELPVVMVFLPPVLIFASVLIPVQIRFGMEKSRIILCSACGVVAAGVWALMKAGNMEEHSMSFMHFLDRQPGILLPVSLFVIMLVLLPISYQISRRLMERKEL